MRPGVRADRLGAVLAALLLVSACASEPTPSPSPAIASTAPSATVDAPASAHPSARGPLLTDPGQPYDAAAILEAMRSSRRPGRVPEELQTDAVAGAVADAIWTFDGMAWDAIAAGGSCGPSTCTLEIGGTRAGATGEDLWVFSVDPASGSAEVATAELQAVPDGLRERVDATVRGLEPRLEELLLTAVRWLPPPSVDRFELSYRSGNEEESCAVDVVLDVGTGELAGVRGTDC